MTFSIYSVVLPTFAYATIALSAIFSPATIFKVEQANAAKNMQYIQAALPTMTPAPTIAPIPATSGVATEVVITPQASEITSPPATTILTDVQIQFLGNCESGMTATRNSGNGYYGAFQFSISTWNSMGTGYARADLAPLEVQIDAVQRLLSRSSIFTQFPGCAIKMRAAGLI